LKDFWHNEVVMVRLIPFLRKEVAQKEAAQMGATKKEDNNDEEDQEVWPSGSRDNDGSVSPIRFPRVKHWFKCSICFNYLYKHKNSLMFHIEDFIKDEMPLDVVKHHR
jgi:hypothetical protein